jgi:transposase-like protein
MVRDGKRTICHEVPSNSKSGASVRNSLKYITWPDRKAFMLDLKTVYPAATHESSEGNLRQLSEKWGAKYAVAIHSRENSWEDLATFFTYPAEIRRLIYTNNSLEGYHCQLRKVTKEKNSNS